LGFEIKAGVAGGTFGQGKVFRDFESQVLFATSGTEETDLT
jgi:hypothetical protein